MLYRALRRFNFVKALIGSEPYYFPERQLATEFHGSAYGGWSICRDSLAADSIVYSLGIGEDATFDLALIAKYGCRVYAYDPTPRSVRWVAEQIHDPRFVMAPIAITDYDGELKLFLPRPEAGDSVSASLQPKRGAEGFFVAPCRPLSSLMRENGHTHIDVLKMDIEGAEFSVLSQLSREGVLNHVQQLLVEFHHFFPGIGAAATHTAIRLLRQHGFRIGWISRTNHEYLFVRQSAANKLSAA